MSAGIRDRRGLPLSTRSTAAADVYDLAVERMLSANAGQRELLEELRESEVPAS